MQSFVSSDTKVCVLFGTTAFRMGIDCPDIRQIIHWGVPNNAEGYVQKTSQCGCDGQLSVAVLYQGKDGQKANYDVKIFATNSMHHLYA